MKKRLLSLLLSLVMVLSLVPVSAFAKDYDYKETAPAQYAVGDTIVLKVEWRFKLPSNIPTNTEWQRLNSGYCQYSAHWGENNDRLHNLTCEFGYYVQYKLVSKGGETPDPDNPDPNPPSTDDPGKVTAHKSVGEPYTDDDDTYYTITLSVQGNTTTASTVKDSDVVLVVDNSGSMSGNRMSTAKTAAKQFVDNLLAEGKNNRIAVIGFAGSSGGENENNAIKTFAALTNSSSSLKTTIDGMNANGGTNYSAALKKAYDVLNGRTDTSRAGVVVFITDGSPGYSGGDWANSNWNGSSQAASIKDRETGYTLYTIGINMNESGQSGNGKPNPNQDPNYKSDLTRLNDLSTGDGYHYNVTDDNMSTQLPAILTKIAYQINEVAAGTDVTMTDVINSKYFKVENVIDVTCDEGGTVSFNAATGTVTWTFTDGKIPTETAHCYITVKVKDDVLLTEDKTVETNSSVSLTYTDPDGNLVTKRDGEIGVPTVVLPANAAKYTVNYYLEGTDGNYPTTPSETVEKDAVRHGTVISADSVKKTFTGYAFDYADKASITISSTTANNVINLYYGKDTVDKESPYTPGSDGIPDKYQAVVTYKVVNGTWENETTHKTEIKQVYTLKMKDASGKWVDVTPAPTLTNIPTAQPDAAYKAPGAWDVTPAETTVAEHGKVYTYTYSDENTYTVTYYSNTTDTVTGMPQNATVSYDGSHTVGSAPTREGYTFKGWATNAKGSVEYAVGATISNIKANIDLYAVWTARTDLSYTVKYLEKDTNKVLHDPKTVNNQTFDTTVKETAIDITGYTAVAPASKEFTIAVTNNDVIFYYTANQYDYTVKYLEKGTTTAVKSAKTTEAAFGTTIKAADEKITISGYVYDSCDKNEITISSDASSNVITLYYEKAYSLTYDPGVGSGTAFTDKHNTATVNLKSVTDAGFTASETNVVFLGWSKTNPGKILDKGDINDLPELISEVTFSDSDKTQTVYAVWGYDRINKNDPDKDPTKDPSSDGTADVYQAVVTYQVVNGTFGDTTVTVKKEVVTLEKQTDGTWSGKLANVPVATDMKPVTGFDAATGGWVGTAPKSNVTEVTKDETYIYRFGDKVKYDITVSVTNGTSNVTSPVSVSHGDNKTITFTANNGFALDTVTVDGQTAVLTADGKYTFSNVTDNHSITVVYAVDKIDKNDPDKEGSDGIPDKYQAVVTFTVVNGKWNSNSGTTLKQVYTFKEKNASGEWVDKTTALEIPAATANTGYDAGSATWTPVAPVAGSAVTADAAYTLTYSADSIKVDPKDPFGTGDGTDNNALVWKELTVNGSGLGKQTFTVELVNGTQKVTGTVEMTAAGKKAFTFDADNRLTFTKAGSYTITVTETKGSASGMTYDKNSYELTIVIAEDAEKGLYVSEVSPAVTVKNSYYRASTGGITIQLEKGEHFNYVMGYSDGTIRPNNQITRAEIAMIFFRLLTKESRDYYYSESNDFTDVADTAKSNIAISTLTKAGIITGYSDGTFRPNAKVTRGQLAAIIARFADMKGEVDKSFTDIDGYWAKDLILLAASNGWIDGYSDGTFRPANNITRAQTMAIINRALDRQVSDVKDLLSEDVMNVWTDNMDPDAWYYFHVQEATNYHAYTRKGVNTLDEKWTAKIKDIDWSVYQF